MLKRCIQSVKSQTYKNIQHLIYADGPERWESVKNIVSNTENSDSYRCDVIFLPYSIGKERWNGHRMYGAGSYISDGEYVVFLDDDNSIETEHIEKCLQVIKSGKDWSYSLRTLVSPEGTILGKDDCESLGKWPSILSSDDYFIDVNCYFLPKNLAISVSPIWYRKFREPGQADVDRALCQTLRRISMNYDCTYEYSVHYTVGNTPLSVKAEFFQRGNLEMLKRYNGVLPWVRS